jgi:hypothetical protein
MSSSSRVRLTRLRETTYGALPTAAAMTVVRRTGGVFSHESTINSSAEVRSDLQVTDNAREDYQAKGTIEDEWTFGTHHPELQDVFGNTLSATINLSSLSLSVVASAGTYTRGSGSWITDGLVVGGVYNFGGLSNGGNNGRKRLVALTATVATVAYTSGMVDEGPTASCTVTQGGHFRMGTNVYSSIFEELYADISSSEIWQYRGGVCTGWNWKFTHPGKMMADWSYECAAAYENAATAGNGTVTDYTAVRVMNSVDHFRAFYEGGAASTFRVKELSIAYAAPKRRIMAAGTLGNVDMGANTYGFTGALKVYNSVAARTVAAKHKAGTLTALEWETVDSAGNAYHFYVPVAVYKAGSPAAGPKDSDVYIDLPWLASRDSVTATMFQLTVFPAS